VRHGGLLAARERRVEKGDVEPSPRPENKPDRAEHCAEVIDVSQRHVADHTVELLPIPPVDVRYIAADVSDPLGCGRLDLARLVHQRRGKINTGHHGAAAGEIPAQLSQPQARSRMRIPDRFLCRNSDDVASQFLE
jgi:hypothetical protein